MRKSIGKKVISMLGVLGVMLLLVVLMNMSALQIIKGLNEEIMQEVTDLKTAAEISDRAGMLEAEEVLSANGGHITLRIDGTIIFDVILIVVILVSMVCIIIVAIRNIAAPAKSADAQLKDIVNDIVADRIDLTKRIQVNSVDEIGQELSAAVADSQKVRQIDQLTNNILKIAS